jgi:hypothetical protein
LTTGFRAGFTLFFTPRAALLVALFFARLARILGAFFAAALRPAAFRATTRLRLLPEFLRAGFRLAVAAGLRLAIAMILSVRKRLAPGPNLP